MKAASKLNDTDLCVMCGMCLPQCPTYQLYQNETESPRGRIALMQAINQGRIEADSQALLHIDHCLGCLNCETICPSRVPYGELIDEFRDQYRESIYKPVTSKLVLRQAAKTNGINQLATITSSPLVKPFVKAVTACVNTLTHTASNPFNVPPTTYNLLYPGNYSLPDECRGEVSLFIGCSGASLDQQTIDDAILILNQLKFDVHIADNQTCCGALHQHNGQKTTAEQLLLEHKPQSEASDDQTRLFFTPACGDRLMQSSDNHIMDIRSFILEALQQWPLSFSTPTQAVALHESCSHRNMLKLNTLNYDLLNCIDSLQIIESSNTALCCGAGGIQSINYPLQADALLQGKLKSFDFTQTNTLISDNIGCSLHIKTAISAYNPNIEIMHPVSFLARHLANS